MTSDDDINLYYTGFQVSLRQRNFERAAGYLHVLFIYISFHPSIISQIEFKNITAREYVRLLDIYLREFPDDPVGYLLIMSFHRERGRVDLVRDAWRQNCKKSAKGFHFQPSISVSIFDAEDAYAYTSLGGVGLGNIVRCDLNELPSLALNATDNSALDNVAIEVIGAGNVVTRPGEPIGLDGIAFNGVMNGFSIPTRYYFRFGSSAGNLDNTTSSRDMPAGRYGRVSDTGDNLFRRLTCYTSKLSFVNNELTPDSTQSIDPSSITSKLAMRLDWPFGKDRNHLDGVGIIDLLLGWQTLAQSRGTVDGIAPHKNFPTLSYPGENIDFRDAKITLRYRSKDLDPKDFMPVAWIHGRSGTAAFPESFDDLTAWAYTDNVNLVNFVSDGTWREQSFELSGQSSKWTFSGSNTEEMGGGMARYNYAPIQEVQRDNVGGNVCIAFVHGSDLNTPEGSFDIAHMEMSYRSRSLIGPGQLATLDICPETSRIAAARLTDGTIGDILSCWFAESTSGELIDLVWLLRDSADIESFKIYQSALAPVKELEIAVSADGSTYENVWIGTLSDVPEDPALWGEFAQANGLAHAVVLKAPISAKFVRLRIVSGYSAEYISLDAFEVFGQGLPFIPSPAPFSFSEKVDELDEGATVFTQLVAENSEGIFEGDVVEIRRPTQNIPHFLSAGVAEHHDETAIFQSRVIAMGSPATLSGELVSGSGHKILIRPMSIGQWTVPRDVRVCLSGIKPGEKYDGACWAENENGRTEPFLFTCEINDV